MSIKKRGLLIILSLFLLTVKAALGLSFEINATPLKDQIMVDDIAEFTINIKNNLETDENFIIKKAGYPFWDTYTKPLQNPISLKVPAKSESSMSLFVKPQHITSVDTYNLDLGIVLEKTGEEQKIPITIGIKSIDSLIGGYVPTVLASVSIPEKIDPRNYASIKITLSNQNIINYSNITIKVDSGLFHDELHYPLGPNDDKTVEIIKSFDAMTPPKKDSIVVGVFNDGKALIIPLEKEFEITEYSTREDILAEESFLKIRKGVKLSSNNPSFEGTVKIEVGSMKGLFTSSYPKAESVKEYGKQFLVWHVRLGKGKTASVYTIENYRPIVVIAALIIICIVLYFLFRSPIVVSKGISNVAMTDGGISDAKIFVRVKNRSSSQINGIEVIDNAPHIAHVEKEPSSIGSMQPHAVLKHPKKGVLIKWNIDSIEAGDERVLSYKMQSRLAILGELNLPAATARCKIGDKVIISHSNRISISN